ncbi:expressed unknown protein [Seminavis robusta]|uniref:Ubiquitin-like domain-containing protein n=1 Tax=Seminavis robusta TaxID=568900 RepID=A0A9N8F4C0_9STRA|nr:expressed unknown protein [Seminavis robusta]|eukprot:Sro2908_g340070.1 n/a (1021) ;mRNA; r:6584-9646
MRDVEESTAEVDAPNGIKCLVRLMDTGDDEDTQILLDLSSLPLDTTVASVKEKVKAKAAKELPSVDLAIEAQRLFLNRDRDNIFDCPDVWRKAITDDWLEIRSFQEYFFETPNSSSKSILFNLYHAQVDVHVEDPNGSKQALTLRLHRCVSVSELQETIQKASGVPHAQQYLYYSNWPIVSQQIRFCLDREQTVICDSRLNDYGGDYGGTEDAYFIQMMPFCALIHTLAGGTIQVGFQTASDTLADLKIRLQHEPPYSLGPVEEQHLFLDGSLLGDDGISMSSIYDGSGAPLKLYLIHTSDSNILDASNLWEQASFSIPQTEYRAISLRQLKQLVAYILRHCVQNGWRNTLSHQLLQPENLSLYDLVDHLVKPLTVKNQCSYVELVASEPQKPKWFVSHAWSGTFIELVDCLDRHARDRGMDVDDPSTTYWVCAFANNQHRLDGELPGDSSHENYLQTIPFYRAINLADGTVSIVDTKATCYTRIWCVFEVAISTGVLTKANSDRSDIQGKQSDHHLYDVYAITGGQQSRAIGLTDGLAHVDRSCPPAQLARQQDFPMEICQRALDIQLEHANATVDQDKKRILHYICSTENNRQGVAGGLDNVEDPPTSHPGYERVNALLNGFFAISSYRNALEQGNDMAQYRSALSKHPELQSLNLFLRGCQAFKDEALYFMQSLPPASLRRLELDYGDIGFESSDQFAVGLGRLVQLKTFELTVGGVMNDSCLRCTNHLFLELQQLTGLRELELTFSLRGEKLLINSFCQIGRLTNLKKLHLAFSGDVEHPDNLDGLASLVNLEELTLNLKRMKSIGGLRSLSNLKVLMLSWERNCNLTANEFFEPLESMSKLVKLELCPPTSLAELNAPLLGSITSLRELSLIFNNLQVTSMHLHLGPLSCLDTFVCSVDDSQQLQSIDFLAACIATMSDLRALRLSILKCGIEAVSPLSESLSGLASSKLDLFISDCNSVSREDFRDLWRSIASSSSKLKELEVFCYANASEEETCFMSANSVQSLLDEVVEWSK